MADKLNRSRVRLCAVVWDLVEVGMLERRAAASAIRAIEQMGYRDVVEWANVIVPENWREDYRIDGVDVAGF